MKLDWENWKLLDGTSRSADMLCMAPTGGGLQIAYDFAQGPRYLQMEMQVDNDHAQAFEVRAYAKEKEPRVIIRFGLMPHFPCVVVMDLHWLDGHILFPGHRVGTQKIVCHGSRIAPEEITHMTLVSMPSADPVKVRLGNLCLTDTPEEHTCLASGIWIDHFGQWTHRDWTGKCQSEDELIATLMEEERKPSRYPFKSWSRFGGDETYRIAQPTGFFQSVKQGAKWLLADPEGNAFFSMGPDCVVVRCDARIDGLEHLLEEIPDERDAAYAHLYKRMPGSFGETPRESGKLFSYERWNLQRAFGRNAQSAWENMAVGQLKRMGMNTLGNWSEVSLYGKMPYVTSLTAFPETEHKIFRDFPDVMSEEFAKNARTCAESLRPMRDDPWMIGYFLRNEPAWAFVDHLLLADEVLRDPVNTACKRYMIDVLQGKYQQIEKLNEAWHTSFQSFSDLQRPVEKASVLSALAEEDMRMISEVFVRNYVEIPSRACRNVDPHHLNLGLRWAWISDPLLAAGWESLDAFSINCYAVDPTTMLDQVKHLGIDRPVLIGEFHFGALDAGLPATGLEAVVSQEERGRAYQYYVERVAVHPLGVGCHWFQCYDQFALGRFDGENYNIGLFDITLKPYDSMQKAVYRTAERIYAIKAGRVPPTGERPQSIPMIAY